MAGRMAGLVTRNADGLPSVNGIVLPVSAQNAILKDEARAERDRMEAELARAESGAADHLLFAARTGAAGRAGRTLGDVLRAALEAPEPRFTRTVDGMLVDTETGNEVHEVDLEPPKSAARMLTAERPPAVERDVLEEASELHRFLVRYKAARDYGAALARARAKAGR